MNNKESMIDKFSSDHSLITPESVFFDVETQMDMDVLIGFLLEEGEDCCNWQFSNHQLIGCFDSFGNNLLHMAEVIGNKRLAYQLVSFAPQLMYQTNQWGHYPVHFSCLNELGIQKYPKILLNCTSQNQYNLLHVAASFGTLSNVEWLLERTDLMEKREFLNGLPLHCALNIYNQDPCKRMKKIMTSKYMLQHLSPQKMREQLHYRSDLGVKPQDWLDSRLTAKEVDFLFAS